MNTSEADQPNPKVSVMIRTMGRASLEAAVNSVRDQTFKDWELIVVNASGKPFEGLGPQSLAAVDRVIEPGFPLDRSSAANMLVDAARGQYAIFLDDDDWFLEGHLRKLVDALDADVALVAAYGDVDCLASGSGAQPVSTHRFERDFDLAALQLENFLPIHSVLFRLDVARKDPACKFEQSLHLFEDWDFWLQLAAKGPFKRVPGISAIYALSVADGSGHTQADGTERAVMLARIGERQLQRWQADDVVAMSMREARRTNQINQESQSAALARLETEEVRQQVREIQKVSTKRSVQLVAAHQSLRKFQENLRELQTQLRLQQLEIEKLGSIRQQHLEQISALMQSTSWRVTRPLRMARRVPSRIKNARVVRFGSNLVRAVRSQIARHGFVGLIKRVPYFLSRREAYLARIGSEKPAEKADAFVHPPPKLRDIRLHPDLTGGGATIDAKVSVVIPTFNAGPEFAWLLRKLRAQLAVRELEIVVVDSGSSDDTVAMARAADAKVLEILSSEFTHSYSRNLGADHATGDYLLIMVQDAYPIGNYWLYGMLRFLLDHQDRGVVAASCAEYSRVDSDMMYDSMINTHYRFLGCLEVDRIGEYKGDGHMALRSEGQLSDVSCLISRALFQQFRYRGNYAEDLDLGVRLIKAGHRVAMLASIKVVHSHNRPAFYYLKRSFVDVIFLVGLFEDFTFPACESLYGLLVGIESTARQISNWLVQLEGARSQVPLGTQVEEWIADARRNFSCTVSGGALTLGDERLDSFVSAMVTKYCSASDAVLDAAARQEARRFNDSFSARLEHFNGFARDVYGPQDALLRSELGAVVSKTFAAAAGSALAFYCLDQARVNGCDSAAARLIQSELTAGV